MLVNDELLHRIASRLGSDWYHLGHCLHNPFVADILKHTIVSAEEIPLQMLQKWREIRDPSVSEVQEICKALVKCHRRDLAEMVRENCQENGMITFLVQQTIFLDFKSIFH